MTLPLALQGAFSGNYFSEDRNLLLNGDMYVDQANEGNSVNLTSGTASYVVDGWGAKVVSAGGARVTAQQVSDAPPGAYKSLKLTVASGALVTTGDYLIIETPVEGYDCRRLQWGTGALMTSAVQAVSAQFWVKSSVSGTFSFALQNSANSRSYVNNFTVPLAGTWWQFPFQNIVGDAADTWLTTSAVGLYLFIVASCGTANQTSTLAAWMGTASLASTSQTNSILSSSSATFQVAMAMVEPGTQCSQFPRLPYSTQISRLQRYYQKTFPTGTAPAQSAGAIGAFTVRNPIALGVPAGEWQLSPTMRAIPAITTYNPSAANANWRDLSTSSDIGVLVDQAGTKGPNGVFLATSGSVTAVADVLAIHAVADARLPLF